MSKQIEYNEVIQHKMADGMNLYADTVKTTLGPKGRNVLYYQGDKHVSIINNGSSLTKDLKFDDPYENMGAAIIRQVSEQLKQHAGDGTTTAVVLTQTLINESIKNISAGANPIVLRKGMAKASSLACAALQRLSAPADSFEVFERIAESSAKDAEIGHITAQTFEDVGADGIITIEKSPYSRTYHEIRSGMTIDRGMIADSFYEDRQKIETLFETPYIFVTDKELRQAADILPILELVKPTAMPLVIIAEKIEGDALTLIAKNHLNQTLRIAAISPPAYGDGRINQMKDICVFTGAAFFSDTTGNNIRKATLDMLGRTASVRVRLAETVFIDGYGDSNVIHSYVQSLKTQLQNCDYDFRCSQLKQRLSTFISGKAVIYVGACSDIEYHEKKNRYENAVCAVRAAFSDGILAGGGTALYNTTPVVKAFMNSVNGDERTGAQILYHSLSAPITQIAANAGYEPSLVKEALHRYGLGFGLDVISGEYLDMKKAGIIDPAKVIILALKCAVSAASTFITTQAGITTSCNRTCSS